MSQKATQKQITIVKIDNRRQVRKRSNAVSAQPPPVLRGVSAQPQPIIPLPPPPDLYEANVLRQRVERLERVREPVREPIRASATIETQTETQPVVAPAPPAPAAPVRRRQGFGVGTARRELIRERLISGVEQRIAQEELEATLRQEEQAPEREVRRQGLGPVRRAELRERLISGVEDRVRFDPITERERLRPVADEPFRREAPAPQFITGLDVSRATENKLRNEDFNLETLRLTNEDDLREMGIPQTDLNIIKDFLTSSI